MVISNTEMENNQELKRDLSLLDKFFFKRADDLQKEVLKGYTNSRSNQKNITLYDGLLSRYRKIIYGYMELYSSNLETEWSLYGYATKDVLFSSKGFAEFHKVCKDNNFKIDFSMVKHPNYNYYDETRMLPCISINFDEPYKNSRDSNFWIKQSVAVEKNIIRVNFKEASSRRSEAVTGEVSSDKNGLEMVIRTAKTQKRKFFNGGCSMGKW